MTRDRPPWHTRLSLRFRMVLIAVGSVGLMLVLGGTLILLAARAQLIVTADQIGEGRADQLAELARSGRLPAQLVPAHDMEAAAQVVRGGEVVSATPNATRAGFFDLPEQGPGTESVVEVAALPTDEDGPFRVTMLGTETPQGDATVFVAVDVEDIHDVVETFAVDGLIGLAILMVAVGALCWVVLGRTLAPVDAISQQAEVITGQRLDQRVPVPPAKDQVHRLARTINDMLGRLELSAKRQERFVADAAHELRTPLASLRVRLETALARGPAGGDEQLLPDLLAETMRLSSLVEQLLLLARSDAGMLRAAARPVDLDDVIRDVVRAAEDHGVEIRLGAVQPVQVLGQEALLEQVVRNLVENAVRYASTSVEISLGVEDEHAVLTVDDDGSGIPPLARGEVFHRFVRLDDARARAGGGVGLGLAIVDEIIRLHSGTVEVSDAPSGGARLVVRLPVD